MDWSIFLEMSLRDRPRKVSQRNAVEPLSDISLPSFANVAHSHSVLLPSLHQHFFTILSSVWRVSVLHRPSLDLTCLVTGRDPPAIAPYTPRALVSPLGTTLSTNSIIISRRRRHSVLSSRHQHRPFSTVLSIYWFWLLGSWTELSFYKSMSIADLLNAAEYLERRERGRWNAPLYASFRRLINTL